MFASSTIQTLLQNQTDSESKGNRSLSNRSNPPVIHHSHSRKTLAETKTAKILVGKKRLEATEKYPPKQKKNSRHPFHIKALQLISDNDRRGAVNNKTHLQFFTPGVPSFPFAHLIHSPSKKGQEQGQKVPYPLETPHTNIKQKGDPWQRRARSFQQLKSCQCCWMSITCFGFKNETIQE